MVWAGGWFHLWLVPELRARRIPVQHANVAHIPRGRARHLCRVFDRRSLTPIADDDELEACKAGLAGAAAVLRGEDFPAAESNQRGIENGLQQVIFGRSEALVQHLHRVWDESSNTMQAKGNQSNEERIR